LLIAALHQNSVISGAARGRTTGVSVGGDSEICICRAAPVVGVNWTRRAIVPPRLCDRQGDAFAFQKCEREFTI
jgi:hypothetical protein